MEIKIRSAKPSDLAACTKIFVREFRKWKEPWTEKAARARLLEFINLEKQRRGANFVLVERKKVIGFAFCEIISYYQGKLLWIGQLAIDEKQQGKGFGTKMLDFLEKFAKRKGLKAVILVTSKKQHKACGFYGRKGYKDTGYFFMQKDL